MASTCLARAGTALDGRHLFGASFTGMIVRGGYSVIDDLEVGHAHAVRSELGCDAA
jgi:hypothetical protein